jgi:hypothetical protein
MADSRGFANHRENDSRWQTGVFAMGQAIAVRTVDSCVQEHQRKIAQIVASPPSRPAPAGRYPNRPARNNAWTEARRRPLQWPIDRPAPGFSDAVSPHIDHLTVGLYPLSRNCCPPHAQKLCHHLRRNLVGDQRHLGNATRSGIRERVKDAVTVVVEGDRAQLWLRARGGQSCRDNIG